LGAIFGFRGSVGVFSGLFGDFWSILPHVGGVFWDFSASFFVDFSSFGFGCAGAFSGSEVKFSAHFFVRFFYFLSTMPVQLRPPASPTMGKNIVKFWRVYSG